MVFLLFIGSVLSGNDGRMRWRFRDVQLLTEHLIKRDEHSGHGISTAGSSKNFVFSFSCLIRLPDLPHKFEL